MTTHWITDGTGWVAAGLCLATFCMHDMRALRAMAVLSNLAFIGYGLAAGLLPVLALHVTLLPLNAWRLAQCRRGLRPRAGSA